MFYINKPVPERLVAVRTSAKVQHDDPGRSSDIITDGSDVITDNSDGKRGKKKISGVIREEIMTL